MTVVIIVPGEDVMVEYDRAELDVILDCSVIIVVMFPALVSQVGQGAVSVRTSVQSVQAVLCHNVEFKHVGHPGSA